MLMPSIISRILLILVAGSLSSLIQATPAPPEPGPIRAAEIPGEYDVVWDGIPATLWLRAGDRDHSEGGEHTCLWNGWLYRGQWRLHPGTVLQITEYLWPEPGREQEQTTVWFIKLERDHRGKVRRCGYVHEIRKPAIDGCGKES